MMLHVVVFMVSPANWCPPGASEGDLIGKLDFCRCNQLRSSWFKVNPDFSGRCLHKREEREIPVERQGITQAKRDRGRGWSDAASGQETPGAARKLRVKEEGFPGIFSEGMALLFPWLGTSAYRVRRGSIFVVLSNLTTCYHSPRNLEQCVLGWSRRNHLISSFALIYTNMATPCGPTRCALGFWGENLGDERKLLGELLMELKLEKQFMQQERKGRRGAPRATEALGQRPGHFGGAERGRQERNTVWARARWGLDRWGQVRTGHSKSAAEA